MSSLTYKQRRFVNFFLQEWNGTQAARLAGYAGDDNALAVAAHRLLRNAKIKKAINARLESEVMSANEVLWRLAEQARGDISEFINDFGGIDWEAVNQRGHLVKEISHNKGKNSSIKLHDSQSALALIGKHHRLFVDRQEITGRDGGPVEVEIKEVIIEIPPEDEPMADPE